MTRQFADAEPTACSRLGFVEMMKLLQRREAARSLSSAEHDALAASFARWFGGCYVMDVNRQIASDAADVIRRHGLRAADAIHLASALLIRSQGTDEVVFATGDLRLGAVAAAEGLRVLE